ncbi:MAG: DUF488 family protein [Pseudomonas stutzeri]|uniref:DUF488 domain-containing protein n=1 Tax=Stutzerimonas stutzeri TaxID=316 RepID=UPI00031D652D|nr:DUF488 family protein [Stutzerimonas stutzeri]MBO0641501.1 DUF488 family protein [Stutzerimonas stutzeri]MDH0120297.1 DUF488 family protein [Stutzerimonas stutzeri]MTI91030.1 DUF488 family protein [Stutzerimonas stutzeri]OCX58364.1 MarR family transcriptional regulator [Stutzerimonas stutzeri]
MIQCKRAYVPAEATDGRRILVDRLWPRGCDRQGLALEAWLADLAPSTELRRAFKNGTLNFAEFRRRYRSELAAHPEHWWPLLEMTEGGTLTLVYAARDEHENNARVLAEWLEQEGERLNRPSSPTCMAGEFDRGLSGDD